MKLFQRIAIGAAFLGMVLTPVLALAQTPTTTLVRPAPDLACMQSAVDKRDTAIIAAFDVYQGKIKTALETRRSALKDAWGKTDKNERLAAIRAAWKNYRGAAQTARKEWRDARWNGWKVFWQDRRVCGVPAVSEDQVGQGVDATI